MHRAIAVAAHIRTPELRCAMLLPCQLPPALAEHRALLSLEVSGIALLYFEVSGLFGSELHLSPFIDALKLLPQMAETKHSHQS